MATYTLTHHIDTPCPAVQTLSATIQLISNALQLHYHVVGDITQLRLPAAQPASFADNLWQHTCFELFIANLDTPYYQEFNFSPSGQWASYSFNHYRERSEWQSTYQYAVDTLIQPNSLHLIVAIPLTELPLVLCNQFVHVGLTAVIESLDGRCSYFALQHPIENPDFHHRAGWMATLLSQAA
jgi:hypothetical protein